MKKNIWLLFCVAGVLSFLFRPSHAQTISPLPQLNKKLLIVVHYVDKTDNQGFAFLKGEIELAIIQANIAFAPIALSFEVCEYRKIANTQYLWAVSDSLLRELNTHYEAKNRINMFIINTFDEAKYCGKASLNGVQQPSNSQVVLSSACIRAAMLHELGHFMGLSHTFESGDEYADGSNCDTAGDKICDTPADPYDISKDIANYINKSTCKFIFDGRDANGDFYDPNVSNIMSYYSPCICDTFTDGQYRRMAENYLNSPILW